jgi:predicted nuclease of predicted toxin-antitoxin system
MKVFLDECIDWRLSRDLANHQVMTARQMGWTSIKNGELVALASREFDVFVTVDRNLSFQQNLDLQPIAVIVLSAPTNRLADLRPLVPRLLAAIASAVPGKATIVGAGSPP